MENSKTVNSFLISETQKTFDQLIARHLNRINEFRTSHQRLPVSIPLLAVIFLIVDREKEIATFQENPVQRFNNDLLQEELSEIGVLSADLLTGMIRQLIKFEYISVTEDGRYAALEPAFRLAQAVDSHFSRMPGMSLIAYLIQSVEEVISGRKEYEYCIRQVDQTLLSRTSFSKPKTVFSTPPSDVGSKRNTADLLKLVRKRAVENDLEPSEPHILSRKGFSGDVKVTEIFPSSQIHPETVENASAGLSPAPDTVQPDGEDLASDKRIDHQQPPDIADVTDEPPHDTDPLLSDSVEQEVRDPEVLEDTSESLTAPVVQEENAGTTMDGAPGAQQEPTTVGLSSDPEMPQPSAAGLSPDISSEADSQLPDDSFDDEADEDPVEAMIKAFEYRLASVCPICETGQVVANSTPKGKTYYSCSNPDCKFISWGKPYHFVCPLCQNKFLIEYVYASGAIGLRCPRATCTYRQQTLEAPAIVLAAKMSPETVSPGPGLSVPDGGKTKKRVVRKKLVRRKR